MYAVGTVKVQIDSAALIMVIMFIFPLALTLTAFLMWIIISLNGGLRSCLRLTHRHHSPPPAA